MTTPVENLLDRLDQVETIPRGWKARCPAHDDSRPSLAIAEGDDGRALVKCWSGCDALSIVQSLGLTLADLFEQQTNFKPSNGRQLIRPNWREIVQLLFHEATVIAIAANKIKTGGTLSEPGFNDLINAYQSISKIIETTEALAMPRRKAA